MEIHIDKPKFNKTTPESNIALLDRWVSDTADKLNAYLEQNNRDILSMKKEMEEWQKNHQ